MAIKPPNMGKIEVEFRDIVHYEIDSERQLISVEFICRTEEEFKEMAAKLAKGMQNV